MNKYVLRTSLVWIAVLAVFAGIWVYRSQRAKPSMTVNTPMSEDVQPAAAGPPPGTKISESSMPEQKMETPLVPVQLTPERMQSIGVRTGTVEYKQLSDDIRATGTVDINERLRLLRAGALSRLHPESLCECHVSIHSKGRTALHDLQPRPCCNPAGLSAGAAESKDVERQYGRRSCHLEPTPCQLQQSSGWSSGRCLLVRFAKLKETGKPITDLTINSPVAGYITERNALPNMYVEPSTRLYTVADLSRVWVYAQIFQNDVSRVKPGDTAQITADSYPGPHILRTNRRDTAASGPSDAHRSCAAGSCESWTQAEAGHVRQCRSEDEFRTPACGACVGGLPIRHTPACIPQPWERQFGAKGNHRRTSRWR